MLFKAVAKWIVWSLKAYSKCCLIPLKVTTTQLGAVRVQSDSSALKRWAFASFVALRSGHSLFVLTRMFLVCTQPGRYFKIEEFPMLISLLVTLVHELGFSYSMFGSNAQTTALVLNEILQAMDDGDSSRNSKHGPSQLSTLIRNVMAAATPLIGPLTVALITLIIALNPSQVYSIYSALPEHYQSTGSLVCSLGIETCLCLLSFSTLFLAALLPLEVQDLVLTTVETSLQRLQERSCNILGIKQTLQEVQVLVLLTNLTCRHVILGSKVTAMTVATFLPFFAIKYYHTLPLMSTAYLAAGLLALFGFIIIYDKAFQLPTTVDELRKRSLVRLRQERGGGVVSRAEAKCFKKALVAVPKLCFKVGDFRVLERESTPLFVDFVVTNIVSLLLAFG